MMLECVKLLIKFNLFVDFTTRQGFESFLFETKLTWILNKVEIKKHDLYDFFQDSLSQCSVIRECWKSEDLF